MQPGLADSVDVERESGPGQREGTYEFVGVLVEPV